MNELEIKVKKILQAKFPDYNDEEINQMITDYGEIIILDTMGQTFSLLDNDESRTLVGKLIGEGKADEAFLFAQEKGVDMNAIFEQASKKAVMDIFSNKE